MDEDDEQFPSGHLNKDDEGQLAIEFGADRKNNVVIVDFGKPVSWFALPPHGAIDFGRQLIQRAEELQAEYDQLDAGNGSTDGGNIEANEGSV